MYQQSCGTVIGSPVLVTVANLVMEDVEERALATAKVKPSFWKRHVDDICSALPVGKVQELLHGSPEQHRTQHQFLVELESNSGIPFLDVLLQRNSDGAISITVYRKPTHTDRYLDFAFHHPLAHKIAVVRTQNVIITVVAHNYHHILSPQLHSLPQLPTQQGHTLEPQIILYVPN